MPRRGRAHDVLERGQVDLAQCALVDVGAHPHPVALLVVGREVLDTCADTLGLDSVHQRGAESPGQERILGEVFEVAPAQRGSLDVDTRSQHHRHVLGARFRAHRRTDPVDEILVP